MTAEQKLALLMGLRADQDPIEEFAKALIEKEEEKKDDTGRACRT